MKARIGAATVTLLALAAAAFLVLATPSDARPHAAQQTLKRAG